MKLKNIFVLLACLLFFLIRGKADRKNKNPRKILIVQTAKLGDMICTTPMFRAVKIKYPESQVYVMGDKVNREILKGNPDVDHYVVYRDNFFDGAQNTKEDSFVGRVKALKKEKIDFASITCPNFLCLAMLYLAGIPLIAAPTVTGGHSSYENRLYKILKRLVVVKTHRMHTYAGKEYLKLLEPIDIFTEKTQKYLFFSSDSAAVTSDFFNQENIKPGSDLLVCFSPSAGNKLKLWGSDNFAKVANLLFNNDWAKIFIVGGKNDLIQLQEMIDALDEKISAAVIISMPDDLKSVTKVEDFNFNTGGKKIALKILSLDELKSFIANMNLFISADTGPIYIAEAFDVATIDITGPVDEKEQPPIGVKHKVIFVNNVNCRPCSFMMNAARKCKNTQEPFICFKKITSERVYQEAQELLKSVTAIEQK